jgi:RDD family
VPSPLLAAAEPSSVCGSATLSARLTAAAADAATVLLLAALAILAARLSTGASPKAAGLAWAAGFGLYLSAFATIVPLVAFGRTVGMALADLRARTSGAQTGIGTAEAVRRWLGTIATAATGGLLLLWTARDERARTPADRLSGCALTVD